MASIIERYADKIDGILSCYDRVVIQGTLPELCYARGMTGYLHRQGVRIFDYPKFAEPLRDQIRENAERMAKENNISIEFIRKASFRKEALISKIIEKRGNHPGLVHILSAMELCGTYRPWHDKQSGQTYLKSDTGKCLHYYFYFIDEELGLCYVRVPTWCPFRLQTYFNGHGWLANKMKKEGIAYTAMDNAFIQIADFKKAQALSDHLDIPRLHARLDAMAKQCCPVITELETHYHWTSMQIEYATDILFKRKEDLAPIYEEIVRTAIHVAKAEKVSSFLGRKLNGNFQGEVGTRFNTRSEGTCVKHHMKSTSIKMYDKFGRLLRIECTVNDLTFFKHHRYVEQKNGEKVFKLAPLKKSIYSLVDLAEILAAANRRYLDFVSEFDDPSEGRKHLQRISEPEEENGRNYRGINFFAENDLSLLQALARGEHAISGLRNKSLKPHLPTQSTAALSRHLKRLRVHGLIKRVGKTYKYYLTELGRRVVAAGLKLREFFLVPQLAISAPLIVR